jgi:hypothetical protein
VTLWVNNCRAIQPRAWLLYPKSCRDIHSPPRQLRAISDKVQHSKSIVTAGRKTRMTINTMAMAPASRRSLDKAAQESLDQAMIESARVWRPAVKIALATMAYASLLLYATGLLALHQDRAPGWRLEAAGPLPVAVSYLVYGTPLGAADDNVEQRFLRPDGASVQALLAAAASGSIPRGAVDMYSPDGAGVGNNVFATAAMALFGIALSSLVKLYLVLVGISVVAFVLRFQDNRLIVVPLYLLVVTLVLITPFATAAAAVDYMPIGGQHYFGVAAILPALHIFFELTERTPAAARRRRIANWLLLFVQAALLFAVILVRSSAGYLLIVLLAVWLWTIWSDRKQRGELAALAAKAVAVGAAFALWAVFVAVELPAYVKSGRTLGTVWHRTFGSLSLSPEWPFGNLRQVYECTAYIPEGLNRQEMDRNGHCVWWAYPPNKTRSIDEVRAGVYGAEYEEAMQQAFFYVAIHYPRQMFKLYVYEKSRRILIVLGEALHSSFGLSSAPVAKRLFGLPRAPVTKTLFAIVAAQGLLFIAFIVALAAVDRSIVDRSLLIFPIFFVASLAPLYVAFANYWTAADTVALFYCCLLLVVLLVTERALATMSARAPLASARLDGSSQS